MSGKHKLPEKAQEGSSAKFQSSKFLLTLPALPVEISAC